MLYIDGTLVPLRRYLFFYVATRYSLCGGLPSADAKIVRVSYAPFGLAGMASRVTTRSSLVVDSSTKYSMSMIAKNVRQIAIPTPTRRNFDCGLNADVRAHLGGFLRHGSERGINL